MSSNELSNSFLTTSPGNVIEQLPLRHRWAMSSNELSNSFHYDIASSSNMSDVSLDVKSAPTCRAEARMTSSSAPRMTSSLATRRGASKPHRPSCLPRGPRCSPSRASLLPAPCCHEPLPSVWEADTVVWISRQSSTRRPWLVQFLLGLLAMIKPRASTRSSSCFVCFFFLAGSWCTPRWRPFFWDWFLVERGGPLGPFGPRGGGACTWWFCFECFGPACGVLFCVCFAPNDEEPIVLKPRRRQPR